MNVPPRPTTSPGPKQRVVNINSANPPMRVMMRPATDSLIDVLPAHGTPPADRDPRPPAIDLAADMSAVHLGCAPGTTGIFMRHGIPESDDLLYKCISKNRGKN